MRQEGRQRGERSMAESKAETNFCCFRVRKGIKHGLAWITRIFRCTCEMESSQSCTRLSPRAWIGLSISRVHRKILVIHANPCLISIISYYARYPLILLHVLNTRKFTFNMNLFFSSSNETFFCNSYIHGAVQERSYYFISKTLISVTIFSTKIL